MRRVHPVGSGPPRRPPPCALCGKPVRSTRATCHGCGSVHHRRCFSGNLGCAQCGLSPGSFDELRGTGDEARAIEVRPAAQPVGKLAADWWRTVRTPMAAVASACVGVVALQTFFYYCCPFVYHPTVTAMVLVLVPTLWFAVIDRLYPHRDPDKES